MILRVPSVESLSLMRLSWIYNYMGRIECVQKRYIHVRKATAHVAEPPTAPSSRRRLILNLELGVPKSVYVKLKLRCILRITCTETAHVKWFL